ncbi:hypothetical protein AAEX63_04140 [Luteococcus sp. H138]|uniref:hypothetical protein n=1 Tax=unclassified Luteococcus TaxID=2639923 RepID=UPI00313C229D
MSALLAPLEQPRTRSTASPAAERPALRAVAASPLRLSRVGFIIFITTVLGLGMVGILLLNTTIQQRAQTVAAAQRTADDLGYEQASLTAKAEQLRSSSDLANRAWEMGMRPNPYPVFIQLDADGKTSRVVGTPTAVSGSEMPNQKAVSADDVTKRMQQARVAYQQKVAQQKAQAQAEAAARAKAAEARVKQEAAAAKAKQEAAAAKAKQAKATNKKSSTGGN